MMATAPGEIGTIAAAVDGRRLWRRIEELARIGATAKGGVNRPALSAEEAAARALLLDWARPLGLAAFGDAAGNFFLRLAGREPDLPPVMTGSHLDSCPTGGRFDGTFGVLAALEAVEALVATKTTPRRAVEIVAWMNEEGSRFAPGMMGSEAFAGVRDLAAILAVRDQDGVSVADALADMNARLPALPLLALGRPLAAFLEAHVEQGPVLEAAGKSVGIVTGIQGKKTFRVTVEGEEAHAGTAPLSERKDALIAATRIVQELHRICAAADPEVKFTVGRFSVYPNAPSVVASRVVFSIDLRHPRTDLLAGLGERIAPTAAALRGPCAVQVEPLVDVPSIEFSPDIRRRCRAAAERLRVPCLDMLSAAGHDPRQMNHVAPAGMIFVPSRGGISHHEAEWTDPEHLAAGARVVAEVVAELAEA
jgi:N-carbamoyl-L-amino-acid hydrolase